jgi:hypothetical protein
VFFWVESVIVENSLYKENEKEHLIKNILVVAKETILPHLQRNLKHSSGFNQQGRQNPHMTNK